MCINGIFMTLSTEYRYHIRSELFRSNFKFSFEVRTTDEQSRDKCIVPISSELLMNLFVLILLGFTTTSNSLRRSETERESNDTNQCISSTCR
jgi:hypothetical protein